MEKRSDTDKKVAKITLPQTQRQSAAKHTLRELLHQWAFVWMIIAFRSFREKLMWSGAKLQGRGSQCSWLIQLKSAPQLLLPIPFWISALLSPVCKRLTIRVTQKMGKMYRPPPKKKEWPRNPRITEYNYFSLIPATYATPHIFDLYFSWRTFPNLNHISAVERGRQGFCISLETLQRSRWYLPAMPLTVSSVVVLAIFLLSLRCKTGVLHCGSRRD